MNDESGLEKGENEKKIIHVYPLVKVNVLNKYYNYIIFTLITAF